MSTFAKFPAILATVAATLAIHSGLAQAQQVLRVSAIPDEAPTELQRKFKPLGSYRGEKAGHEGGIYARHRLRGVRGRLDQ